MSTPPERIAMLESEVAHLVAEMNRNRTDIETLKRFQNWIIGIGSTVGFVVGLFSDAVKKKLGI